MMKKCLKVITAIFFATSLYACSDKPTRVIVDGSSMGDFIMRKDSVDIISAKGIKNGDVVVVNYGYDVLQKKKVNRVYRVAAGPGDIVKISNDDIYVNNKILLPHLVRRTNISVSIDSAITRILDERSNISFKVPVVGEQVNDSFPLLIAGNPPKKNHIINTKCFFLLNDDFTDKHDSRLFGLVPVDSIIGIVKEVHHR